MAIIQGDSGRKVSILEPDSITYCEKGHVNTCLIMNGYREKAVWMFQYNSIVNCGKEREITYCEFNFYV